MAKIFSRIPNDSDWDIQIDRYYVRVEDIEIYLSHLDRMEGRDLVDNPSEQNIRLLKIMKNNIHIMVYNLVESTIIGCLKVLKEKLRKTDKYPFEIQRSIFTYWLKKTTEGKNELLFHMLYENKTLKNVFADEKKFKKFFIYQDGGGNWDSDLIRKILFELGILSEDLKNWEKHPLNKTAFKEVKRRRNSLGHGDYAFSENIDTITVNEIKKVFQFVKLYLREVMCIMIDYTSNEKFIIPA